MTLMALWGRSWRNPAIWFVCISFVASFFVLVPRSRVVWPSDEIEVVLDYRDVPAVFGVLPYPEKLDNLKRLKELMVECGFTTLGIPQATLGMLEREGHVSIFSPDDLKGMSAIGLPGFGSGRPTVTSGGVYVLIPSADLRGKILDSAASLLGQDRVKPLEGSFVFIHGDEKELLDLPLAFLAADPDTFESAGIRVIGILPNPPGVNGEYLRTLLHEIDGYRSLDEVLFEDDQVLGYPSHCELVGSGLSRAGIKVAILEGKTPKGFEGIAKSLGFRLVKSSEARAYHSPENLALAAEERGVRLFYARLAPENQRSPFEEEKLKRIVRGLSDELERAGFKSGPAGAYGSYGIGAPFIWLMCAGALAAACLAGTSFCHGVNRARPGIALCIVIGASISLLPTVRPIFRELCALMMSFVFPLIALQCCIAVFRAATRRGHGFGGVGFEFGCAAFAIIIATVISCAGGFIIAALLGDVDYAFQARLFRGVKFSYVAPLFLVYLVNSGVWRNVKTALNREIDVKLALWLVLVVIVGLIYIGRSGHSTGIPVPEIEMFMRGHLESTLGVRPRIKEFLVGHPALMVGLFLCGRGFGRTRWPFYVLGAVGQVSVINSFTHLHVPVEISVLRSIYGVLLGVMVGFLLIACLSRWTKIRSFHVDLDSHAASGATVHENGRMWGKG